jgi:hypothetical protein
MSEAEKIAKALEGVGGTSWDVEPLFANQGAPMLTDERIAEIAELAADPIGKTFGLKISERPTLDQINAQREWERKLYKAAPDIAAMARELLGWREQYGSFVPEDKGTEHDR